jgi:hypothetical protein
MRWEFQWLNVPLAGEWADADLEEIDGLGAEGWEAYAVTKHRRPYGGYFLKYHLKRPRPKGRRS